VAQYGTLHTKKQKALDSAPGLFVFRGSHGVQTLDLGKIILIHFGTK
jgi:hypothetical protein